MDLNFFVVGPHSDGGYTVQTKQKGAGQFIEGEYQHTNPNDAQRVADIANKALELQREFLIKENVYSPL
jgi:hypothetical protein